MFKVNAINGESIETTSSAGNILGKSTHKALEVYAGGGNVATPKDEGEAIKLAHSIGLAYLNECPDGFIKYNSNIPSRANLNERYAFTFFGYIKEYDFQNRCKEVLLVEKMLKYRVEVDGKVLPIPLKGSADLVYRDYKDRICIDDHKITTAHSKPDAIDGAKLLQAAFNYFLVYAELGEAPYKMTFREFKYTKNSDGSPQTQEFAIVYDEHPLIFDYFFRMYQDVTDALLGKQVYVPNVTAMFDREVSILAYIHRLDVDEEREKAFKRMNVSNITDFLKKRIQRDSKMKKFMDTVSTKFISAQTLNYKNMEIHDRIKMKLAEHGIGVDFDSAVVGPAVTLYRYDPTVGVKMSRIEQFAKDIELVTSSHGVRVLAPIPGTELIGFEVPNKNRSFLGSAPKSKNLRVALGVDIQGDAQYLDIKDAPHLLIAGSSGSGKSVLLNSMLNAIGGSADLWLMDPKQVELEGIPHAKYADTRKDIASLLAQLVHTMEERYTQMKAAKQRTWQGRAIIAVIDEFGDLMSSKSRGGVDKSELEDFVVRLAQKGRASGIHLIIATQRPSVDVITGLIKANFPTRVALKTASPKDSEIILGVPGAEKLTGKGDMLLMSSTEPALRRLQGYSN